MPLGSKDVRYPPLRDLNLGANWKRIIEGVLPLPLTPLLNIHAPANSTHGLDWH